MQYFDNSIRISKLVCLCLVILSLALYPILNFPTSNVSILRLPIDDLIPILPVFAVAYILYLPFVAFFTLYFVSHDSYYRRYTLSIVLSMIIASVIFYYFQTTVPRPNITGSGVFDRLLMRIYELDKPYNCFPSLHTSLSITVCLYLQESKNKYRLWAFGLTILIIISTVTLKQHFVIDILGGIVLSYLTFEISRYALQK